ncbi:MAG: helicase-related protein, partial [Clostridiales bacterium]
LPPGRQKVKTYAVGYAYEQRIYGLMEKELIQGHQAFVVCPLIEESEKLDLDSAEACYQRMKERFSAYRVGLLHGRIKAAEKQQIMSDFVCKELDILVATTVIEVGVDVPNATVMLIRDAERFGLAQLHQLRGRIGRGVDQSYCLLLHHAVSPVARQRMKIIAACSDGFALAEADLQQRGPGEFFGLRQHGLPQLKVADLYRDGDLLQQAREDIQEIAADRIAIGSGLAEAIAEKARLLSC